MKNYSIHYSYKGIGDVIIILFDNKKKPTHSVSKGRVTVVYHDEEIIGYNIFDVKDIVKIRNEGMIHFPSPQLIEVINTILINAKVEPLEILKESGYYVGQIKSIKPIDSEKNLVSIELKDECLNGVTKYQNLKISDKVVVAKVGTHLNNGDIVKESENGNIVVNAHICTNSELGIDNNDEIFIVDEDIENGKDFFTTEVI